MVSPTRDLHSLNLFVYENGCLRRAKNQIAYDPSILMWEGREQLNGGKVKYRGDKLHLHRGCVSLFNFGCVLYT
jgi:hypothetical protein